jgi:HD-like signal output (HDOD) protein
LDTAEFWRWSVATGIAAQVIAERSGDDADVAYAIGLMHRVGMLAVEEWARLESSFLVFAHRGWVREYCAAEAAVLGFTHAEVGAALLHAWNFPQSIREPIRCQYVPLRYGPHARMTCVLHAAKWLGATVCADESDAAPEFPADRYLDVLHLTSFDLAKLVVDVRIQLGGVRNHLAARAA